MIVELEDGKYKFDCLKFKYTLCKDGVYLDFTFKKIPDILLKFAIAGHYIKNIRIYIKFQSKFKDYLSKFKDVQIYRISESDGLDDSKVYMTALKIQFRIDNLKKRVCSKYNCDHIISEISVMSNLLTWVGKEIAENIWNSEDVIFYCCHCYFDEGIKQGWLTPF